MSENKQLITPKIPVECYEFIKRAAKTTEFFNHNHVVEVALKNLQEKTENENTSDDCEDMITIIKRIDRNTSH